MSPTRCACWTCRRAVRRAAGRRQAHRRPRPRAARRRADPVALADEVVERGLNVRQAEALAQQGRKPSSEVVGRGAEPDARYPGAGARADRSARSARSRSRPSGAGGEVVISLHDARPARPSAEAPALIRPSTAFRGRGRGPANGGEGEGRRSEGSRHRVPAFSTLTRLACARHPLLQTAVEGFLFKSRGSCPGTGRRGLIPRKYGIRAEVDQRRMGPILEM